MQKSAHDRSAAGPYKVLYSCIHDFIIHYYCIIDDVYNRFYDIVIRIYPIIVNLRWSVKLKLIFFYYKVYISDFVVIAISKFVMRYFLIVIFKISPLQNFKIYIEGGFQKSPPKPNSPPWGCYPR